MTSHWRGYVHLPSLILALGCATTSATVRAGDATPANSAILQVMNSGVDDQTIFLIRSGTPIRLGTVPGLSPGVCEVSGAQLGDGGELQLPASTRSNARCRSSVFMAAAGQKITGRSTNRFRPRS